MKNKFLKKLFRTKALNEPTESVPVSSKAERVFEFMLKHEEKIINVASAAKDILATWSTVNTKSPLSVGLGVVSTVGSLRKIKEDEDESVEDYANKAGFGRIQDLHLKKIIFSLYKDSEKKAKLVFPKRKLIEGVASSGGNWTLSTYDDCFYFMQHTSRKNDVEQLYIKDRALGKKIFLELLQKKYSRIIRLNVQGKETILSNDIIETGHYIGKHNEHEIYEKWKKFADKGFGRPVLLIGPPGLGKSTLARRLVQKVDGVVLILQGDALTLPQVSLESIISWVNPEILLLDDIDRMQHTTLIALIERFNALANRDKKIVIATANYLSKIDKALRRPGRFDEVIFFELPNEIERLEILKHYMKLYNGNKTEDALKKIAKNTKGMSPAYLMEIAKRISVLDEVDIDADIAVMQRLIGTKSDFESAGENLADMDAPSNNPEELDDLGVEEEY